MVTKRLLGFPSDFASSRLLGVSSAAAGGYGEGGRREGEGKAGRRGGGKAGRREGKEGRERWMELTD